MTLAEYLAQARTTPFRYGVHDCALFAAGWVLARTGRDLVDDLRYASRREGLRKLRERGHRAPVDVLAAAFPEVPPAFARAGDIALLGSAMGIVAGERIAVLKAEGLGWMMLTDADRAFRLET